MQNANKSHNLNIKLNIKSTSEKLNSDKKKLKEKKKTSNNRFKKYVNCFKNVCTIGAALIAGYYSFSYEEKPVHIMSNFKDNDNTFLKNYLNNNNIFESQDFILFPGLHKQVFKNISFIENLNNMNLDYPFVSIEVSQNPLDNGNLIYSPIENKDLFIKENNQKNQKKMQILRLEKRNKNINVYNEYLKYDFGSGCSEFNPEFVKISNNNNGCYILGSNNKMIFKNFFNKTINSKKSYRSLLHSNYSSHNNTEHLQEKCVYVKDMIELPKPDGIDCAYFIAVVWVGDYFVRYPIMILMAFYICCCIRMCFGPCNHRTYTEVPATMIDLNADLNNADESSDEDESDEDETDEDETDDNSDGINNMTIDNNSNEINYINNNMSDESTSFTDSTNNYSESSLSNSSDE